MCRVNGPFCLAGASVASEFDLLYAHLDQATPQSGPPSLAGFVGCELGLGGAHGPLEPYQPEGESSFEGGWDLEMPLSAIGSILGTTESCSEECWGGSELSAAATHFACEAGAEACTSAPVLSLFSGARGRAQQQAAVSALEAFEPEIPDVLPPGRGFSVVPRPSSAFIEGHWSSVRDEEGRAVQWPWLPASGPVPRQEGRAKAQKVGHRTDDLVARAMAASMADGKMGRSSTGVRAWHAFCAEERTPADRPIDPLSPLWVKLQEEQLAMQFVCALVQDRGVSAHTAACYFGQVQGWHSKEHGIRLAAGMKLSRLPAMLKGLRKILGDQSRAVRRGIAPQALKRAMDLVLDPNNPSHANIRAALSVALQGLLRGAEFACDPGVTWAPARHLTRADIAECTAERLILMMLPCKNMRHLTGKTCPLVIGAGGSFVDAVAEVRNMLRVDPTPPGASESTPLFRDPTTNGPLRTDFVRDMVRTLMGAIGERDPSHFGSHSLRIGGATALFAAGADPTVIRTMGRWSSDCYRLYVRACFESTLKWTKLAGSSTVHDLAGEFVEVDYY